MKKAFGIFIFVMLIAVTGFGLIKYWPYVFARTVTGVITDVQRVSPPAMIMGGGLTPTTSREMFSFAVAIKEKSGEIATASSEDRQWAVAQPGQCAEAKFYPYPPWEFEKSGTFFGARLMKLHVCDSGEIVREAPAPAEAAPEAGSSPASTPGLEDTQSDAPENK